MSDLNDFIYTDGIHDVLAIYVNRLLSASMRSEYKNIETLSADRELSDADTPLQRFDCGSADRVLTAPAEDAIANHPYFIINASTVARTLILKDNAGAVTLAALTQGQSCFVLPDGDGGYLPISVDLSGYLLKSGLTEWDEQGSDPSTPATTKWKLYIKSGGLYLIDDAGVVSGPLGAGGGTSINKNILINGGMQIWQRNTSFTSSTTYPNNDDAYTADRVNLLSDGNNVVSISRQTSSPPAGSKSFLRATVVTANKKFGIFLPLEGMDSIPLQGKNLSLSFQAKTTAAAIRHIRAAVVSWTGTEDSITSDIISSWAAEGANPTLVANWTYENTPSDLSLTTSWQLFEIENIAMDTASIKNVGVFIWVDDADAAVNDIFEIGQIKLEDSATATAYQEPLFVDELVRCLRYYQKSFDYATAVAQNAGSAGQFTVTCIATNVLMYIWRFVVAMRATPTMTGYNPAAANANWDGASNPTITFVGTGTAGSRLYLSGSSTAGTNYNAHASADAEL